jgi:hypothetical protein
MSQAFFDQGSEAPFESSGPRRAPIASESPIEPEESIRVDRLGSTSRKVQVAARALKSGAYD